MGQAGCRRGRCGWCRQARGVRVVVVGELEEFGRVVRLIGGAGWFVVGCGRRRTVVREGEGEVGGALGCEGSRGRCWWSLRHGVGCVGQHRLRCRCDQTGVGDERYVLV